MKSRQLRKQKRITKRFVKRSGKRVASAALAAATFGTVAVAGAMTPEANLRHSGLDIAKKRIADAGCAAQQTIGSHILASIL